MLHLSGVLFSEDVQDHDELFVMTVFTVFSRNLHVAPIVLDSLRRAKIFVTCGSQGKHGLLSAQFASKIFEQLPATKFCLPASFIVQSTFVSMVLTTNLVANSEICELPKKVFS